MLLYLIRHAQPDEAIATAVPVHDSRADLPCTDPAAGLGEIGRYQARKLGGSLQYVPFAQCWTSPAPAALQTARIVMERYHPRGSIMLDPLLDEAQAAEGAPKELDARIRKFLLHMIKSHTPLTSPVGTPRTPISPSDPGAGCVLIVTHADCIAAFFRVLTGAPSGATGDRVECDAEQEDHDWQGNIRVSDGLSATGEYGHAGLSVVRVWWEEGAQVGKLAARGRVEMWGNVEHLVDDLAE